jgi:hypothetical protein
MSNIKLNVLTHYFKTDPEHLGDYTGVEIFTEDGKRLICYGDAYSDKGFDRAAGFLQGYSTALGPCDVTVKAIADSDEYGYWDNEELGIKPCV